MENEFDSQFNFGEMLFLSRSLAAASWFLARVEFAVRSGKINEWDIKEIGISSYNDVRINKPSNIMVVIRMKDYVTGKSMSVEELRNIIEDVVGAPSVTPDNISAKMDLLTVVVESKEHANEAQAFLSTAK